MDGAQSRIDRIYVKEDIFNECTEWGINASPIPTDHDIISAKITIPSDPIIGRGQWAILTRLVRNKRTRLAIQRLGRELQERLKGATHRTAWEIPQKLLKKFKVTVRDALRDHERRAQPMIVRKIETLTENLRRTLNDDTQPEDKVRLVATHIRREIHALIKLTHQNDRDFPAAVDTAEGEKIGKTWSNHHKVKKPQDIIKCLRELTGEGTVEGPKDMAEIAARCHETLQHQEHDPIVGPEGTRLEDILGRLRARVSETRRKELKEDTNEDQVREALRKTNREKAPGLDGIPIEQWKSMDNQFLEANKQTEPNQKCDIVWVLTQVFLDIEEYGMDPDTELNEGCMTPIYKKKSPDDIANYHPITLLNTDYKIFTKALSIRLADMVPEVVNRDQAGFIQN